MPIPVAAQSQSWVCGRSLDGIAGFESRMGNRRLVSCECCVARERSLRPAAALFQSVVLLSVVNKTLIGDLGPLGTVEPLEQKIYKVVQI